jgi:hypothetical protein
MVFGIGERVRDQTRRRAFKCPPELIEIGADRFRRTV